jgi:tetratricopeptide (TPR) repeat protein
MSDSASTFVLLLFVGFLAVMGAALTIMRYWLAEGALDTAPAIGLLGGLLALTAAALKTASPLLISILIVVVIAGTVLIPLFAARGEQRDLKRLREQELARYRSVVEANPQFAPAWREMAEIYMRLSRYDDAIMAYKEAIRLNPPDVQKIRRRLNAALEYRAGMPHVATLRCDQCGQQTPKAMRCMHCGALLELEFLDWLLQRENLRGVLRPVWALTVGAGTTFVIFMPLSVAFKVVVVAVLALIGAWLLWRIVQDI